METFNCNIAPKHSQDLVDTDMHVVKRDWMLVGFNLFLNK